MLPETPSGFIPVRGLEGAIADGNSVRLNVHMLTDDEISRMSQQPSRNKAPLAARHLLALADS